MTCQVEHVTAVQLQREAQILMVSGTAVSLQAAPVTATATATAVCCAVALDLRHVWIVVIHPVTRTDLAVHSCTVLNVCLDQLSQHPVVHKPRAAPHRQVVHALQQIVLTHSIRPQTVRCSLLVALRLAIERDRAEVLLTGFAVLQAGPLTDASSF